MNISDLTPSILRELIELSEQKQKLQNKLIELDSQITALGMGKSLATKPVKAPKSVEVTKPTPKAVNVTTVKISGTIKERVLAALVGKPEGMPAVEIAKVINAKPSSLGVFFATQGKTTKELKKIGRGLWALA